MFIPYVADIMARLASKSSYLIFELIQSFPPKILMFTHRISFSFISFLNGQTFHSGSGSVKKNCANPLSSKLAHVNPF